MSDQYDDGFYDGSESRQGEIDKLHLQLADMKSQLNDSYSEGQTAMFIVKQAEIDELKAINMNLHQGQQILDDRINELQKQIKSMQKKAQRIMIAIDDDEIDHARRSARKIFKGEE